ncbi:hypothetical protein SEUCBS139899_009358 [Sporothrix eucalyptigena]|uniref:Beta-lactamase-related domain-containing protein n=1 Tax=Sporothrix eucalyptigena TaxID=1812306 RepID=A0ABP0AUB3_9PEZI
MDEHTRLTRKGGRRGGFGLITALAVTLALSSRLTLARDDQQPLMVDDRNNAAIHETFFSSYNSGETHESPFDDTFRALVADTLASWHIPGIAIAVVDGDHTWVEGFGIAACPDTPVTPDTLFYTASTTKAFVAATLSLMIESGNYTTGDQPLDWTTPLATILPDDFVVGSEYTRSDDITDRDAAWATQRLTIEDALFHRSGFAAHDLTRSRRYGLDPSSLGRNATVRDVTRSLRHLPLHTSPRTEWRYCNLMYLVLSHAMETLIPGHPWLGDVLHDWLWKPLGMASTFFSLDDARAAPNVLAKGYYHDEAENGFVHVPHMPLEEVSGAGGVISSVRDYAQWLRCWIDGPAFSDNGTDACAGIPFNRDGLDAVLTPKMFIGPSSASPEPFDAPMTYASAWQTTSYKGHRFWGHSGGSNAFGSEVYFFPDDRFGLVLFGNTADTSNVAELILMWHLVNERFGIPQDERYDWDTRYRQSAAAHKARIDNALERLFPVRADPPKLPALSPIDYTGNYHHPAYQNMTIQLAEDYEDSGRRGQGRVGKDYDVTFVAERRDHTWPTLVEFVHVSGEHWLVYTDMLFERSGNFKSYGRAWFEVGADGQAHTLVVEFWNAADDTIEGVIPFARIE